MSHVDSGGSALDGAVRALVWAAGPAVRAGLAALLERGGIEVVTADGVSGLLAADVIVADVAGDRSLLPALEAEGGEALPMVLIAETPAEARLAEPGGAPRAWLLRDATAAQLAAAVHGVLARTVVLDPAIAAGLVARGPSHEEGPVESLTEREREVLRLIADGLPNKAIALELGISEHTVKFHVGAVLSKLGAHSRAEAVATAARSGVLVL